ncbi:MULTISPECIES: DUF4112 domain-containing protein [unclassified Anabaena]|uniref:DUF4112 domain-containing protein n=1 Tax=unclassified Anabaena TaxID=2619674 RepID=UPI000832922A|nr:MULTISPECIES: DUF4112 domain-containing protein [unclassified Anabaena]
MPDVSPPDYNTPAATLKRLRLLSRLLDKVVAIPGTPIALGLDPILGLIPVGGDVLGIILSSYIVIEAARLGIPKKTLSKMVVNILIDTLVGAIPVLGDIFDFGWKANEYNLKLIEQHLNFPR